MTTGERWDFGAGSARSFVGCGGLGEGFGGLGEERLPPHGVARGGMVILIGVGLIFGLAPVHFQVKIAELDSRRVELGLRTP